ncbi:hypothetical protein BCR41DRAFT_353189 [Lobosporangium transversale]|uniref:Uncharacterized protein n=1 Tax=Lobosporangium transversale TaxID=64571 RepID=A0A1Y2GT20_9FUNG|nr:hypothetical protein BCR41DRAFT_353189 [Lobosporangium transversale]ORZ16795.1 hypothetical protein BCR41DRAFT_353189 [Lobosporangium transversale]|eukprot:XP_021881730.1 hypothetical protein BCR41DRAFT_353189 [Lobosporangium transversale]
MSSISQQRCPTPVHPSTSSQHLTPHTHSHTTYSYTSSISSAPSRPSSPASMLSSTSAVLTPPQSPKPFQLKTFANIPGSPPPSTSHFTNNSSSAVITLASQNTSPIAPEFPSSVTAVSSNASLASLLTQPVTRIVLMLTVVQSLIALAGHFPDHCSDPSHVLHAAQYPALVASPFIVPLSSTLLSSAQQTIGTSLLLGMSNIISFALFEERLTTVFNGNGTRIFRNLFLVITILVLALRQLLGFLFSRALGWQFPQLFFSDSMYECNLGLAPFLFALLVVQALFPHNSTVDVNRTSIRNIRRIYIQVVLCLLNVIPKTIVWWAGSGLIVGFVVALVISYQRRMGRWGGKVKTSAFEKEQWEDSDPIVNVCEEEQLFMTLTKEADSEFLVVQPATASYNDVTPSGGSSVRRKSVLFTFWKAITYIVPMIILLFVVLIGCNQLHTYKPDVTSQQLNTAIEPQIPYLLTLVLMTAPRRNGVAYIKETLTSYLDNFPEEYVDPLYSRIQIVVYTHFTDFEAYDQAKGYFDTIPKARKHVKWVREEGSEKSQRKHLISAIRKIGTSEDTVYLGIMEDDFPFCKNGWQEMLNILYEANRQVPDHCGAFIATGGSGLIFKRSVALAATFILENDVLEHERGGIASPPDVTLQNCMLGKHDYCSSCAGTIVISKALLQGHLGYNSSTSGEGYHKSQFQCGWRHPFNGLPVVHAL